MVPVSIAACFSCWQRKRLNTHLKWVASHAPFYQDFLYQPLEKWPIINKALMIEHFNQMNTAGLELNAVMDMALAAEQARDFNQLLGQGLSVGLSSGTSGQRSLCHIEARRAYWLGS